MIKTPSLGVRLDPEVKDALENAAIDDARSVSSLVQKIVSEWLKEKGYLDGPAAPKPAGKGPRKARAKPAAEETEADEQETEDPGPSFDYRGAEQPAAPSDGISRVRSPLNRFNR
jgi:hypothetical protein